MDHLGIAMERAAATAKLERLNADLVRAQATIAADARIKAVGELAAAVADHLNNLAGVALMAVSIGERSQADAADALPRIARANRAISDLVARLQRVARTGATNEASDVVNVTQVVDDVVALLGPMTRERAITLSTQVPASVEARCDPVLFHQIVLNLVLNAYDALGLVPANRRRLHIRVIDDGEVRLLVTDSGEGISEAVLSQMFKPFVTTKAGHTGIALAAAHASLKHFGGTIVARNVAGAGAEFEVGLPRARREPAVVTSSSPAASHRQGSLLVVDDDPDILSVVQEFLEPAGYRIVTTTTGEQAIDVARTDVFDAVLCDVGMPKLNGFDVCGALREQGYRGKFILMTGWDHADVLADQRSASCDLVLAKPFLGADLLHALDSVL